jgi:hypothetical protein
MNKAFKFFLISIGVVAVSSSLVFAKDGGKSNSSSSNGSAATQGYIPNTPSNYNQEKQLQDLQKQEDQNNQPQPNSSPNPQPSNSGSQGSSE